MEKIELTTMTLKSAGMNPKKILAVPEADRKPITLGKIIGITSSVKIGFDKNEREYTALIGDFIAFNYDQPDTQYFGGKLFLPEGIHDRLVAGTIGTGEVDAKGRPIYNQCEFAVELIVVPANNPQGYSYQGKMLVDAKPSDPLAALLEKSGGVPALPAPKAEVKEGRKEEKAKA